MCTIDKFVCRKVDHIRVVSVLFEIMTMVAILLFVSVVFCMNREESLYCKQD